MKKQVPVRTRCPHCHKFHFAHNKELRTTMNLSHIVGMGMFLNMVEHDPDLKPLKQKLNKLLPEAEL